MHVAWASSCVKDKKRNRKYFQNSWFHTMCSLLWWSSSENLTSLGSSCGPRKQGQKEMGGTRAGNSPLFSFSWEIASACAQCGSGNQGQGMKSVPPEFYKGALGPGLCPLWNWSKLECSLKFLAAPLGPTRDYKARWVTGPKCLTTHYLFVKRLGRNNSKENTKTG